VFKIRCDLPKPCRRAAKVWHDGNVRSLAVALLETQTQFQPVLNLERPTPDASR
jgi:hypothetical protein